MPTFITSFGINLTQAELDFVDIDISTDNRLYLDPYAIQIRRDEWSSVCGDHIRSFFNEILSALIEGNDTRAAHLLSNLHEPNETFLGQSQGNPSGRGVGNHKARDLAGALRRSRAFKTGLISDISEAELFIAGIGPDTISDLTTNILRGILEEYTISQCEIQGIPIKDTNQLPPYWNIQTRDWTGKTYRLPHVRGNQPVLLVPKFSVRRALSLNSQEFWNHHMISFLQREYLDSRSALVQTFKDGTPYVTKKSVKAQHPLIKDDLADFVQNHPEILESYKRLKGAQGALESDDFEEGFNESLFSQALIERLDQIPTGNASASDYHRIAMGICTFLFYPNLITPVKEFELHQGRKRIDIKYTNASESGFFQRMLQANQTRALSIMIECKNYTKEINNPELDQLSGRFGHQRGFFGIMLCRSMEDRLRTVRSCRDSAGDGRGFMIVLEDKDLISMLEFVSRNRRSQIDIFLQERFDEISH